MHSKFMTKAGAAVMAAAMAFNGMAVGSASVVTAADEPTRYEFEDATLTGTIIAKDMDGASNGQVAYMTDSGSISLDIEVPTAGMYSLTFYAAGEGGSKTQALTINGVSPGELGIPESKTPVPINLMTSLSAGKNTIVITKSWGWSWFDYMTVESASDMKITASQTTPCNQYATAEAKSLMNYLSEVYGNNILSGQQEIYNYGHGGNFEQEFEYLNDLTGHYPAIRGFDFLNCANILYGSEDGTVDRMIDWAKNKNGIVTASWHITVPKSMAGYKVGDHVSYENATYKPHLTDFVPSNILVEGTVEREFYLKSLENIAGQLQKLQDEGVPVLFRPLHEAEGGGGETGGWFWWAKDGSAVYKEIWNLTYDTLTYDYGLNNLIWEWNSYNFATSADWYPGDDRVDIIGYDKYSCTDWSTGSAVYVHNDSAMASTFYGIKDRYDSKKMIAMMENDSFSTVDNLVNDKAAWLYFCTWYDGEGGSEEFLSDPLFNTKEDTITMYQSDYCITLDELPDDLYTRFAGQVDPAQTTTRPTTTKASTTTTVSTEADPTKSYGKVIYNSAKNYYEITLPEASADFYIDIDPAKGVEYANGGLGVGVEVDGEYYWANIQWEYKGGSTSIPVNVVDDLYNVSLGTDVVEDEAIIEAVKKELGKSKTYQGQVWYVQIDGEAASNTDVKIKSAYIKTAGSDDTTTETVPTTSVQNPGATLYGDANCDGKVEIADATLILQFLTNKDEYQLTDEGMANADCANKGDGVTALDALAIQKIDAGIYKLSDLPVKE